MSVIDVHTHFVPDFVFTELAAGGGRYGLSGDAEHLESAAGRLPLHYAEMQDPVSKLAAMDARGVDESVVSLTPHLFIYGEAHEPVDFARRANDALAAFVAASPRLHGVATLPLGRPEAAADELRRAVRELGLRGAIIGTGLSAGEPLDRIGIGPLFAAAEELGVPLILHPFYCGTITDPELFLNNSLGVPFDTAWAVARLMAGGVLDEHPGVKLVLPHGGGALPSVIGRLDNAWERRPGLSDAAARRPSEYLDRCWFDSITHRAGALRGLAELAGADRILLGTDSPYLTGDTDPRGSMAAAGLDPDAAGASARELFGLAAGPEPVRGPARPGAPARPDVREAILARESLLLGPVARTDAEMLERLIHPGFDETGRTGHSWSRAEAIEKLQTLPHQTERVAYGRVIELAPGVAHLRFRTHDDRGIVHRSGIWINEGDGWRERYHQGTPDTQPAAGRAPVFADADAPYAPPTIDALSDLGGPRCEGGSVRAAPAEMRDAVIACERRLLSPAARTDPDALDRLIHPDFDEIGRTGYSWTRDEVIAKLQTVPEQTLDVEFGRVIRLAEDVAHIRFRTVDADGVVHRSSIWIRESGEWRQRYHQGTPDTQSDEGREAREAR
ncbi:DUF4440 domain-containing protein [Leucobacter zeae]|nr:DUF4440 domain-containing protein [Leucobacter zeae]